MYHGDIRLGDTIDIKFTTRAFASGAPTTLAGTPSVAAYPANSTTEVTAGITLSVDFDSRTGLNNVRVVASGGNGYATATNYVLVITAGTVGGTSVVGECVGSFSIEARSALMPTTAAVTLDVAAGGEAGIDWGNVANKTTTNALTNTSIITTQKVDVDTIKTNPVVNAGTITFPTTATLASTTNITAGTIATVTNLTNAPTNGDLTATMKTSVTTAATAATPTVTLAAAAVQAIWDAATSALTTAGSIGKRIVDFLTGDIYARIGAPAGASVSADIAAVKTDSAAIKAKTDNLPASPAAVGSAMTLTAGERNAIADAAFLRQMVEAYAADGAAPTLAQALFEALSLLGEFSIAGTMITHKKRDGSTTAFTAALDDATTPTSRTRDS